MNHEHSLNISWGTIIKIFLAIFIFYVIYMAKEIAIWFFFALIISILLEPAINFLRWLKLPKFVSVALVYLSIFGVLGLLIYSMAPIFTYEIKEFLGNVPRYFGQISPFLSQFGIYTAQNLQDFSRLLTDNLQESSTSIINAVIAFFGGLASTISILTLAFFLSLEENGPERFLILLTPKKYEDYVVSLFQRVQAKVAGWFGARLLACAFVGAASFVIFYIFGVKYAFSLALLSGILNFVPYIGPLITSVVVFVFIIVSTGSWETVAFVLIAILIVQQLENVLITPMLMKKMLDLPPALVLIALLVGAQVFGFLGTIFAVPVFGIVYEFAKEFLEKNRNESED